MLLAQSNHEFYNSVASTLIITSVIALIVWFIGPILAFENHAYFLAPEKRIYVIVSLFLLAFLKFLLIDFEKSYFYFKDANVRKKMEHLQIRLHGALQFIKKTKINSHGQSLKLKNLPWYLLIGPKNAGKTSLLAKADIHYILKRKFSETQQKPTQSVHPDWWITRELTLIDIPSHYLAADTIDQQSKKMNLWQFFLRMVKHQRGAQAIDGVIVALPLPEFLSAGKAKICDQEIKTIISKLQELQDYFKKPLPLYFVITKCDLLSGFATFFAECSKEELNQAWGITLPKEATSKHFDDHFNALIKRLNQQLIWRLHQERNPMLRPAIKDFPLQIERLKHLLEDVFNEFQQADLLFNIHSIHLTSSLQAVAAQNSAILEEVNNSQRGITVLNNPKEHTRPYFLKQLLLHGLQTQTTNHKSKNTFLWKKRFAYLVSILMISTAVILFGKDFEQGIKQAYAIQNYLNDYQISIQQNQNSEEHLAFANQLLNSLANIANKKTFLFSPTSLLTFYSTKSQEKAQQVYTAALKDILMPEVANLFADQLKNPVNKNIDYVYAVLKSYLMFIEPKILDKDFLLLNMEQALQKSFDENQCAQLKQHVLKAFNYIIPQTADDLLISKTRQYLLATNSTQLAYAILKNLHQNNTPQKIQLASTQSTKVFAHNEFINEIPAMYTATAYTKIMTNDINVAAQETLYGNTVLGKPTNPASEANLANLIEELKALYINQYITQWEQLLNNLNLQEAQSLAQLDSMVETLLSNESPLLRLLHALRENTFFEPIASYSPKLQSLALLLNKESEGVDQLYKIFASLQNLHYFLQNILKTGDQKKAAYDALTQRMLNQQTPDAITELHMIAEKSPEPIKLWLNKIANSGLRWITKDAGQYIDISWQEHVFKLYEMQIANRYPFNERSSQEVNLEHFVAFFGNPGLLVNFYQQYLQPFVEIKDGKWQWKAVGPYKLAFASTALKQIQQAFAIHHAFFPNADNKLFVQFNIQPQALDKNIRQVTFNINGKIFTDLNTAEKSHHLLTWPTPGQEKSASVELTFANAQKLNHEFPGEWGWFRMVKQAFESTPTKKQLVINLSQDKLAKYLVYTEGQNNPFIHLNLQEFSLPSHLYTKS